MEAGNGSVLLRDVTVRYGRRIAVEAVSGEFASGSLTAVVGANGAGKSTLLAAIAGVVRLAGGAGELLRAAAIGLSHTAFDDRSRLPADSVGTHHARRVAGVPAHSVPRARSALRARVATQAAETVGPDGAIMG